MNKLRKSPPSAPSRPSSEIFTSTKPPAIMKSMTMQYATHCNTPIGHSNMEFNAPSRSLPAAPREVQPLTATEQYWAARALKAEALLSAQEVHQKEVKSLGYHQDMKRERELTLLAKEYKEKHASLERLLWFLLGLIALLVVLVIYLATHYTRHSLLLHHKSQTSFWSAIGASHFTIPILSPFTSVVEHESSVIGSKSIGAFAAISACLVYMVFRYWFSHKVHDAHPTATSVSSSASNAARAAMAAIPRAIDR